MKTEIDTRADLRPDQSDYFDARDYALMITMRAADGLVEIQHQASSDDVANRDMARLAAEIREQLEPDDAPIIVRPPNPGFAVLMCRCGRVLNLHQMHRARRRPTQDPMTLMPIVCKECAA